MAIPQVTFPIEQEQVKPTHEKLSQHLRGLQADVRITQELLRALQTFCGHKNTRNSCCQDCGMSWGD